MLYRPSIKDVVKAAMREDNAAAGLAQMERELDRLRESSRRAHDRISRNEARIDGLEALIRELQEMSGEPGDEEGGEPPHPG